MFGFGFLMMFLMMGLPVIVLFVLFVLGIETFQRTNRSVSAQTATSVAYPQAAQPAKAAVEFSRTCAHCGAGL